MQESIAVGISLPKHILSKIDTERGDVPRSRYLQRILRKTLCYGSRRQGSKQIVMQPSLSIPPIIVEECIPSCEQCPSVWINEEIGHRILCRCKKCNHGITENAKEK